MTQRRCHACHIFYEKKLRVCPECDTPEYAFSKPLRTGQLNSHLYDMQRSAHKEKQFARARGLG